MKRLLLVLLSIGCLYYLYGQVSSIPATSGSGGGGAPTDASYITLGTNGTLTNERVITPGTGITGTDAGAGSTYTIAIDSAVMQSKSNLQSGATLRCASSTGSDDYKCSMTPTLTAYTDGMVVEFEATATANTGAATLEIDSLGGGSSGVAIKKCDGSTNPDNSDIAVGRQIALRYDGTVFRLPCNPQVGVSTSQGTYASLPGTCTTGDLYFATNSLYQQIRCSATNTWTHFADGKALTLVSTLGSWTAGGTAGSRNDTYGYTTMVAPNSANHYGQYTSVGSTTFDKTFLVRGLAWPENYGGVMVGVRDSSNGRLHIIELVYGSSSNIPSPCFSVRRYSTWDSFNTEDVNTCTSGQVYMSPFTNFYVNVSDNGTNIVFKISPDGNHWITLYSVASGTYVTAANYQYVLGVRGSGTSTTRTTMAQFLGYY